jgi:hypothetical protein
LWQARRSEAGAHLPQVSGVNRSIASALPSLRIAVLGSILWCAAITICVWFNARLMSWGSDAQRVEVILIVAGGALIAFIPGVTLARLVARHRSQSQFMAALLLGLALSTIGLTTLTYLFQFRSYFAIWHDNVGEHDWYWQQFFTTASAFYQFAVLGTRLYLPLGPLALIAAAYVLSTKRL